MTHLDQIERDLETLALSLLSADLVRLASSLAELPKNSTAYTYTVTGFDGSPYLTRTLLPRVRGWRPLIHQIHRADADAVPHNHPWREAHFRVVRGGYVDERWERSLADGVVGWTTAPRLLSSGDVNWLCAGDFHRAIEVQPGTITVGLVADRVQDWGFLVDDAVVPHEEYFRRRGYVELVGSIA